MRRMKSQQFPNKEHKKYSSVTIYSEFPKWINDKLCQICSGCKAKLWTTHTQRKRAAVPQFNVSLPLSL